MGRQGGLVYFLETMELRMKTRNEMICNVIDGIGEIPISDPMVVAFYLQRLRDKNSYELLKKIAEVAVDSVLKDMS